MKKEKITQLKMLHEVEAALNARFKGKVKVVEFINELHLFVNGQLFILKLKEFNYEKNWPVE